MLDVFQWALSWLLTIEVVGMFAGFLASFGVPSQFAPLIVIVALLMIIWKVNSDPYMIRRWRRKLGNWHH